MYGLYELENKLMTNNINWPLLGGIRFFLAFIVLTEHLSWFLQNDPILKFSKFSPLVAVIGFLVVSGFSIAASFESDQNRFYFRRMLRIIPIYILSIFFSEFVSYFNYQNEVLKTSGHFKADYKEILGNLFFMQGFFTHSLESNPIVWTLSIEIFFYFLAPYIQAKSKWILLVIVLSALLFITQRYLGFFYYSQMLYGLGVAYLGWAWLIGYWYYHHRGFTGAIYFLSSLVILSVTLNGFFVADFWTITWIITCTALGFGHCFNFPFLFSGLLKTLGDISYPLYLLHIPVFKLINNLTVLQNGFYYLIVIIIVSFLVDKFFDRPIKTYFNAMY